MMAYFFIGIALVLLGGCGGNGEDPVLARVGDTEITAAQLRHFEERLPKKLKSKKTGVEKYQGYLQDIIDKELLIREARQRRLHEDKALRQKLAREKREHMLNVYLKREVYDKVTITDEELKDHQLATERDRAVKVRRVVVASQSEAEEIIQALRAGADFGDFAGRSLLESTLLEGGKYLIKDNMYPPILKDRVFPLAVGEVSEPVEFNEQYGVYQVVDASPVGLESVRDLLTDELLKEKIPPMLEALVNRLRAEMDFSVNDDAIERLAEGLEGGKTPTETERQDVLYQQRDGHFTAGEFVDYAEEIKVDLGVDTAKRASWFANKVIVPRILLLWGINATDIENEAMIVSRSKRQEEAQLLVAMQREAVADILVDESEAHQFYDQHPRFFRPLEAMTVQEILLRSQEEAVALLERIAHGEDLEDLAEEHTLRRQGKGQKGIFHIHTFDKRHAALLEAAQAGQVGDLIGPVEVEVAAEEIVDADPLRAGSRFYSLFKIMESTIGAGLEPFAKVEKRARALVRQVKRDRAFHQFLLDLRYRNKSQIEVFGDRLKNLVAESRI